MVKCCVDGCRSNSKFTTEDITFHRFPDVRCFPKLFLKWSQKVSGCSEEEAPEIVPQPSDRVCSLHFTEDDFAIRTDRNRTRKALRVEALPTQRLPTERVSWRSRSELSELNISQVTGSYNAAGMASPDANGNTDTSSMRRLPTPDEGIPNHGGFGDKTHLPPKVARKKIKLEPKDIYQVAVKSTLGRDELEALIQVKQTEIAFSDHPDSSQPHPQCSDRGDMIEDASHIPPCFRAKKDLRALFAFVITPLDPEEGFDLMMINDNKYVKCDTLDSDRQMWRCILKNCAVRITTSTVHCSILVGLQGVHYHVPTKDIALNAAAWAKTAGPGWGEEPEPGQATEEDPDIEVEEVSCGEPPMKVPPWVRNNVQWPRSNADSRFGVKDLLAPNSARFQQSNIPSQQSAMTPVDNIQAAFASLTKYSGGQLIAAVDPFSALRFQGSSGDLPNVTAVSSDAFPRPQSEDNGMGPQSTSSTTQQDEPDYVLQSPASERSNVIADEASEGSGSNSEPLGPQLGEPLYQQLVDEVDVHAIMQKDPLALEESNDGDPKSDDQQPTEGPGMSPLPPDFVPFFESLGPHLELLSPDLRQLFKAKVVLILSELCKKVPSNAET